jgi:TolB-like protein
MGRRLAAILAADVVGYSRMMAEAEDETLALLKAHRADLFDPKIAEHHGRIIKLMGDGVLVEFSSVVDAVNCAVSIQSALAESNSTIRLRIGINLGDVIVDGDDIYGDGVNIAARLEAIAEPGTVCISDLVHQSIRAKADVTFADMGEQELKNISEPVRAWQWPERTTSPNGHASAQKQKLPVRLSIAVLPFSNMSADPEQEYFSDGITEDIITELNRFQPLFVIARNSSFAFKGQAIDVVEVAEKLGVQFVVQGSVRRAGERIRISTQLIEAATGSHLWTQRYDRDIADIFAVQDEVASSIATMVSGHVDIAHRANSERKHPKDVSAYDLVLRSDWASVRDFTSEDVVRLLEQALEIDPTYAEAHAKLAVFHSFRVFVDALSPDAVLGDVKEHAAAAARFAPGDAMVHAPLAEAYMLVGEYELAEHHVRKALSINPNGFLIMAHAAEAKALLGDHKTGIELIERASLNDPYSSMSFRENKFDIYYVAGRYASALEQLVGWPDPPLHVMLAKAAVLAQLGRITEAEAAVRYFESRRPEGWDTAQVIRSYYRMCARPEDGERWLEGFRKAGIGI